MSAPLQRSDADLNARGAAMAKALSAMLDRVSGSRDALPLMAALERSLQQQGLKAIDNASLSVLTRIAGQLATLPVAPHDTPMHDLQTYLLARLEPSTPPPPKSFKPSLITSDELEVSEGSMSDFMAVQGAAGSAPAP